MTLHHGDCLEVMRELPDASVDAVVTDPPYGLGFMGKAWDSPAGQASWTNAGSALGIDHKLTTDRSGSMKAGKYDLSIGANRAYQAWCEQWATEAFRVLKPGGYLLAFGGTRTYHRLASAIEDAGFEIRDTLMWIYASGFPKSLDVSKALDKVAGAERTEVVGTRGLARWKDGAAAGVSLKDDGGIRQNFDKVNELRAPATDLARKWEGWGTALKPAHEPIVMARKPLIGTVAQNVTRYGTGALNIDGARIGYQSDGDLATTNGKNPGRDGEKVTSDVYGADRPQQQVNAAGRWPSNVLLSSPELFDEPNPGVVGSGATLSANLNSTRGQRVVGEGWASRQGDENSWRGNGEAVGYTDSGGYSRFFRIPKRGDNDAESDSGGRPVEREPATPAPMQYEIVCERCGSIHPMPEGWEPLEHLGEGCCGTCGSPQIGIRRSRHTDECAFSRDLIAATTMEEAKAAERGQCDCGFDRAEVARAAQERDSLQYPTAFLIPKASRAERERGLESLALMLHRERGECDKLQAWESADPSPSDPTASTSPARGTFEATPPTIPTASSSDTSASGKPSTGRSPRATRSTTSTGIRPTTASTTSSSLTPPPTSESTPGASLSMGFGGSLAESVDSSDPLSPSGGTSPRKAGPSTGDADPATSARWSSRNACADCGKPLPRGSSHPTVKPIDLMRHLVRLVTPPGGTVLDPFAGSGSTLIAAQMEGFAWIGIEREAEYVAIAEGRLNGVQKGLGLR